MVKLHTYTHKHCQCCVYAGTENNVSMRCDLHFAQSYFAQAMQPRAYKLFEHYFLRFLNALHNSQGLSSQQGRLHADLFGNVFCIVFVLPLLNFA